MLETQRHPSGKVNLEETGRSWRDFPLTLRVCGAADDVGDLGLEAGVGGAVLAARLVAARAQRHHTLHGRVGPQVLALMDGQGSGVIDQQASILKHTSHGM